MKRTKQVIGILLIIFAVAALVYWETDGRDRVVTKKILVAAEDIIEGELITRKMLKTVNAMPDSVIPGAFTPEDGHMAEGKEAARTISKNQQISELLLREPLEKNVDLLSPFLIKSDWIDSRSSSLRRGDIIAMYNRDGSYYLGDFEVVFVKDAGDKEITDAGQSGIRERVAGSGVIDHLEILTRVEEYQEIVNYIEESGEKLLIVQRGDEK